MIHPITLKNKFTSHISHLGRVSLSVALLTLSVSKVTAQSSAGSPPTDTTSPTLLTIGRNDGAAIPPTFMGIAHEWGDAQALMGGSSSGINTIYRNLLGNLTTYGSGPLIIRIGGNSSDTSKEPTPNAIQPFAELASVTGAHFYLGVNLGANNVQLAVDQTKAFLGAMPPHSIDAIEIGNEPDSYVDKGMRSAPYSFPTYLSEFDTWRKKIYPLLPSGTGVLGPSWAYPASLNNVAPFLQAEHSYLHAVSQHLYIADACQGKMNPADTLLKPTNTSTMPARMHSAIVAAHNSHVPFRIDELNSIACGGQDGLSNAFGAALWSIDIMFELANAGVDGVNWQSPNGAAYSFMNFRIDKSGNQSHYSVKSITPLYYGLLFFQAAAGNRAHLMPVSMSTDPSLKVWATRDANGKLRLVVINKGATARSLRVAASGSQSVSVLRLTAPSVSAKTGVSFAGQTIDGSVDGKLQGSKRPEVTKAVGGNFQISVGSAQALIAEFNH